MKKALATLTATGVLTLAVLAGTAATASAATASPSVTQEGPAFATAQDCETYVKYHNKWGVWDCEYVQGHWYAFAP
ncbi:hypothetical protein [Streptomyces sp. NPDC046727]|uniref:hypothetical protein n=1 Tax=Streptomyces sp. NPDC046727 TaxID=3155373 RepID=UPI0033E503FB